MKGIILAGGFGTRLFPLTLTTSKQLLPIYDKPMVYYPLSTLMLADIRDILLISTASDLPRFEKLLGDGQRFGVKLSYAIQEKPEGLAQAFLIGENFIGDDSCALILGDNIFYGNALGIKLKSAVEAAEHGYSTIFGYSVKNPYDFGIIEFDANGNIISLEEKPRNPKSNYAATGLYFYNNNCVKYAKRIRPSSRGELEITDLNNMFLKENKLRVELLGRGYAWIDTGTIDNLVEAANFVKTVENRQGLQIASLEEIAYNKKWITENQMQKNVEFYGKSMYADYLKNIISHKEEQI